MGVSSLARATWSAPPSEIPSAARAPTSEIPRAARDAPEDAGLPVLADASSSRESSGIGRGGVLRRGGGGLPSFDVEGLPSSTPDEEVAGLGNTTEAREAWACLRVFCL